MRARAVRAPARTGPWGRPGRQARRPPGPNDADASSLETGSCVTLLSPTIIAAGRWPMEDPMEPLATFVPLPGHVLKVSGEIDLSNADAFAEALELNGTNGGVTI